MPGVQGKYTIDVTNRFGLVNADEDDEEEVENVDPFEMINEANKKAIEAQNAPKPKVPKKKAPLAAPAVVKEEDKRADNNNRRGGGRRDGQRGGGRGRPRTDRPPRQNDNESEAPQREDRPRGGYRGGRGGRGGGGGRGRFDRRSGDPRTTMKGSEKREGGGAGNWGTTEDDLKAQTEPIAEQNSADNVAADGAAAPAEGDAATAPPKAEPLAPPEPEEVTMTLEEYRSQKKSVNRNPNAKRTDEKEVAKKESTVKVTYKDSKRLDGGFLPHRRERGFGDDRRGGRGRGGGGRGGGARGDRPRDNNTKKEETAGFNLAEDFPTLG